MDHMAGTGILIRRKNVTLEKQIALLETASRVTYFQARSRYIFPCDEWNRNWRLVVYLRFGVSITHLQAVEITGRSPSIGSIAQHQDATYLYFLI